MAHTGKAFLYAAPWLALLPEGVYFDTSPDRLCVDFQRSNHTIEWIRVEVSKAFGLTTPWDRQFNKSCNWWEYTNRAANGVTLRIYGDTIGPAACRRVEETYTEMEEVPVKYEWQEVTKRHVRWVCPGDQEGKVD